MIAPVQATERKWSGCSFCSTNNWNEETILGSTHWSPNQLPNNGDSLLFDNLFPTHTNNNFSDLDVSNIKFTSAFSNRWVTGNQIDLIVAAGDGIQSNTDATITFDTALSLQGSRSITVNTSGNIVLNGNITDSVLNNNTHDLFPSIIKTGQGKLTLGGNNSSMHGDIDVKSGTLVLKGGNVLSDNTTVVLSSGTVARLLSATIMKIQRLQVNLSITPLKLMAFLERLDQEHLHLVATTPFLPGILLCTTGH